MRISDWSSDVCSSDLSKAARAHWLRWKLAEKCGFNGLARSLLSLFRTRPKGRDRSEEHTSELQSLMRISYAVFCLKKKKKLIQIVHSLHTITLQLGILTA